MEEYIGQFPLQTQTLLTELRNTIKQYAPEAQEIISYNMPAYKYKGMLVYFAGYKNHIGLYPTASGVKVFEKELAKYKTSKGAIQFPLDKSLPLPLIKKIIKYRVKENEKKEELKLKKKI